MQSGKPKKSLASSLGARRRAVAVDQQALVRTGDLRPGEPLPLLVQPALEGVSLGGWLEGHGEEVERHLRERAGVLFRGFSVRSEADFEAVARSLSGSLIEYTYRSTPRSQVHGRVYTSTEYPADQSIPLHNEMAYSRSWPMKIWFFCALPADQEGETPIADSRRVYELIDPAVRERFESRGVLYVRNYGGGLDLSWEDVFQTSDRGEVERFCRDARIELEWKPDGGLRTRQVCQATAIHPVTGEPVWFNQAHLFHVSSLDPAARESLLEEFGEAGLPRNTYYGDGTPLEEEALQHVREVYERTTQVFPWNRGDILLLDNMLAAHGRRPYAGRRRLLAVMSEPKTTREVDVRP